MNLIPPHMGVISPGHIESLGTNVAPSNATSSATWPAGNLAIYVPFTVWEPFTVTHLAWVNGAAVSGNVDMGIYDEAGTRLTSTGATAQSGTNAIQIVDITDITLGPGLYYMAMSLSSAVGTIWRNAPAVYLSIMSGVYEQASAHPLPANATFAAPAQTYIPAFCVASGSP